MRVSIPQQRDSLIGAATARFAQLEDELDALEQSEASAVGGTHHAAPPAHHVLVREAAPTDRRDRDATDVVNHLHAWHVLLIGWLDADAAGRKPGFPAEGYTWAQLDALNRALRDRYREDGVLADARERLRGSHRAALARVEAVSDADLFEEPRDWAHGTLAEPVHECLGGHYEWALGALEELRRG